MHLPRRWKLLPHPNTSRALQPEQRSGKKYPVKKDAIFMMTRNPEAQASSGWNTDDIDGLMAKIDAAAEAMADLGDPERGTKVLHGIGRPA